MERKIVFRYLILIAVLVICAAAAWRMTKPSPHRGGDVVLAQYSSEEGFYHEC